MKLETLLEQNRDNYYKMLVAVYSDYSNDEEMLAWGLQKLKDFRDVFKEYLVY